MSLCNKYDILNDPHQIIRWTGLQNNQSNSHLLIYYSYSKTMKNSKLSTAFLTKLSPMLAKFKSSSTINVAHQQIRKLFSEYAYADICLAFLSKMDSCDNLSDKQKKQYSKIYITLMDAYGQQVILTHYQRFIQSLAKKSIGIGEAISHLCKTLLNRIYPTQNIENYIKHLLVSLEKNVEIPKIIKQVIESFDPELTNPFQSEMIAIINEKIGQPKHKNQCLEALLAIILALEQKFTEQPTVQHLIIKHFKSDDWNTRKLCVDIGYALLVINNQANKILHQYIKDLKYDKIKHVRDSVANYNAFYKQVYGEQQKMQSKKRIDRNDHNLKGFGSKSPTHQRFAEPTNKSLDKSIKQIRNQSFFEKAKDKDVIKVPDNQTKNFHPQPKKEESHKTNQEDPYKKLNNFIDNSNDEQNNSINFENYLKDKPVPLTIESPQNKKSIAGIKKNIGMISPKSPKAKPQNFEFKARHQIKQKDGYQQSSLKEQFEKMKNYISEFESRVNAKLDNLAARVHKLENTELKNEKQLQESFNNRFNSKGEKQSFSMVSNQFQEESDLPQKIQQSILNKNWDEAYSLALSNKSKKALFELLAHDTIPTDSLVENCLLTEVRKHMTNLTVLKWILHYVQEGNASEQTLNKLERDLSSACQTGKENQNEIRNFRMLKKMILNEITDKILE